MKVAGDYHFDAPPQEVWEALLDPEVLAAIMPGCKQLELTGENQYEGVMDMKVGPVQGQFKGKVNLEDLDPPNGYNLRLDGQGAPGFVKATSSVAIVADGDGTKMTYEGDAQVGGRIASVGQRLLDSSSKAVIKQSLEGLNSQVVARSAAAAGEEVVAPTAPTQADFAKEVAKEVAKDLVPKPVLIGGVIVVIVLLLLFFFVF